MVRFHTPIYKLSRTSRRFAVQRPTSTSEASLRFRAKFFKLGLKLRYQAPHNNERSETAVKRQKSSKYTVKPILFPGVPYQPAMVREYMRRDIVLRLMQWSAKYNKVLCIHRTERLPVRVSFDSEATLTFFALSFNTRKPCRWLNWRIAKR